MLWVLRVNMMIVLAKATARNKMHTARSCGSDAVLIESHDREDNNKEKQRRTDFSQQRQ